jgi:hypothetical protein
MALCLREAGGEGAGARRRQAPAVASSLSLSPLSPIRRPPFAPCPSRTGPGHSALPVPRLPRAAPPRLPFPVSTGDGGTAAVSLTHLLAMLLTYLKQLIEEGTAMLPPLGRP